MELEAVNKQGARITRWTIERDQLTGHHLDTNAKAIENALGAVSFERYGIATFKGFNANGSAEWTILNGGQFTTIPSGLLALRIRKSLTPFGNERVLEPCHESPTCWHIAGE